MKLRSMSLIIGSLLSMAIVCTEFFHFQAKAETAQTASTEQQQENDSNSEILFSFSSYSLPTTIQLSLNLDTYCLFEILFEKGEITESTEDTPLYPEKLLLTLFRFIIAPNAP